VRKLSNSGHPEEALELIAGLSPIAPESQIAVLEELKMRCRNHIARRHFEAALLFNDSGDKKSAIRELLVSLSWREDYHEALERLEIISERERLRNVLGEESYFEGVQHLEHGDEIRARTSFLHATNLLTDPQLAEKRLDAISLNLAEESYRLAETYLQHNQVGMAWDAVQDAIQLGLNSDDALATAQRIDDMLMSESNLGSADIKVRAGEYGSANDFIERAASYSVTEHASRLIELRSQNEELRQQHRYLQARSYELDSQLQRAHQLYVDIFVASDQFGFRDTAQRMDNLSQRLADAEAYYQQALLAVQNGDVDGCKQFLREVLQISIDYKDALFLFAEANQFE
jgi:tetratricopeptide (TPR) repeat protein